LLLVLLAYWFCVIPECQYKIKSDFVLCYSLNSYVKHVNNMQLCNYHGSLLTLYQNLKGCKSFVDTNLPYYDFPRDQHKYYDCNLSSESKFV